MKKPLMYKSDKQRKFIRYGRFCSKCDKYYYTYSKHSKKCIECKTTQQQIRYFNKFPNKMELNNIEVRHYIDLLERGYHVQTIEV